MSYEGYEQLLCENGHYLTEDCYEFDSSDTEEWRCPVCQAKLAWWNSVDITNGSYEDIDCDDAQYILRTHAGVRDEEVEMAERVVATGKSERVQIDGYVELEIDKPAEKCVCEKCRTEHVVAGQVTTFKMPVDVGHGVETGDAEEEEKEENLPETNVDSLPGAETS